LHGSAFEYLRNDALDARNFFANQKPPLHLNQFGGAVGPIRKTKRSSSRAGADSPDVERRGARPCPPGAAAGDSLRH
jgi:hypothetical protein